MKTKNLLFFSILIILTHLLIPRPTPAQSTSPDARIVHRYRQYLVAEHFTPGASLTFSVYESQGAGEPLFVMSRDADESGAVGIQAWEYPDEWMPGNYVVATDGITTKDLVLEPVTIDVFDVESDLLAGTTMPGEYVYVWVANESTSCFLELTADPVSGVWEANFSAQPCDIQGDMNAAAQVFDEDGDVSEAGPPLPSPGAWFTAFPEQGVVEGWNWPLGAVVHLAIDDPNTAAPLDYEQDETVVLAPWGSGQHWLWFEFASSYDMKPGDVVTLSDGVTARRHVVQNLSIAAVDSMENSVAGLAGESQNVTVWSWEDPQQERVQATADNEGKWVADFDDISFDLVPGYHVRAEVWDGGGNDTAVDREVFPLQPPTGYHDYDQGDVPHLACNAGGWAIDPDDPYQDVNVRILVDGVQVMDSFKAENYRQDLEISWNEGGGGCPGGTCAFEVSLWDYLTSYVTHEITVEAQDLQSGDWSPLNATPKTLTCRSYDIYAYDTLTGETRQITNLPDSWEFNPRWSPDGKKIVHDMWSLDFSDHRVYITDVETGESNPLAGADTGSYPTWSPNGQWVAFDRGADGDYRLFIVPPSGGDPKLVREDADMASWAPNSQRLAFHQPSDGSIRTVDLNGGNETLVIEQGNGPAWSPNGQWIAYELDGDLWKVNVDVNGIPLGNPIQLTGDPAWEGRPSWSAGSQTIAFHAGYDQATDIWTIPAVGGAPARLAGGPDFDDYDPNFSNNGRYVAYSGYTPMPSPPAPSKRPWISAFTYDLPVGTLAEGEHPYHFEFEWSSPEPGGAWAGQGGDVVVSGEAPLYDGYVLLRGPAELRRVDQPGGLACEAVDAIHPDQPARFLVGWVTDGEMTYPQARAHFESMTARVVWDDGATAQLSRQEIRPYSVGNWPDYVCTWTLRK